MISPDVNTKTEAELIRQAAESQVNGVNPTLSQRTRKDGAPDAILEELVENIAGGGWTHAWRSPWKMI